jgi:hypothetical protein
LARGEDGRCPLCLKRKGRRACPAKGAEICPHCCGSKRRVEIDCPEDCVYLGGGHAVGWDGRETEKRRDARRVVPFVARLDETQVQLYYTALLGITGLRARRSDLDDRLLAQAVAALRKTVDTRSRGILYEHQAEDARAQGLMYDLRGLFEAKDESGRVTSPSDHDLLPALTALGEGLEATRREDAGPTAFLDTAARLVGRQEAGSRSAPRPLIIEP